MRFQTPQFIDVESKIVGPLTLRQFLYFAGAGGASFIFYFILAGWLWFLLTAILGAVAVALAFVKYNGQPLLKILFAAFGFFWKPKLYLWQRIAEEKTISIEEKRKTLRDFFSEMPLVKKLMIDLATTKNPIPKREKSLKTPFWGKQPKQERIQIIRKITGEKEIAKRVDYR